MVNSQRLTNKDQRLLAVLKDDEGFVNHVYPDTVNKRTIGYGFNLEEPSVRKHLGITLQEKGYSPIMSRERAGKYMQEVLIPTAINDAVSFVGGPQVFDRLDPMRQRVLVNMAYQLGINKLNGFHKLRESLQRGNYQRASAEILDSKAAQQAPNRFKRHAQFMLQGGQ